MAHSDDELAKSANTGHLRNPRPPSITSTVSIELLRDLLDALERLCGIERLCDLLERAGISTELAWRRHGRITHEQLVRLYHGAAVETGDEMMGLWSRPIRTGALKVLCINVRDARSVGAALYRFTQTWNLLLDDYELNLHSTENTFGLRLSPRRNKGVSTSDEPSPDVNRFGHTLMLKLAHGVVSWLVGHEVPLRHVAFAFPRPSFAEDFRVLFPIPVEYGADCSTIHFHTELAEQRFERSYADLRLFLERAPRDWIFTTYKEHTLSMKVKEFLGAPGQLNASLRDVSRALHMSPRTMIRRLVAEDTSFQGIKDALRRDFAISELVNSEKALDDIAHDQGFASVSAFHRAFKSWTGNTPGDYRRRGTRRTTVQR